MNKNIFVLSTVLLVTFYSNMVHTAAVPVNEQVGQRPPCFQAVVNALAMKVAGLTPDQVCDRLDAYHRTSDAPDGIRVKVGWQSFYRNGDGYYGYWSTQRQFPALPQ